MLKRQKGAGRDQQRLGGPAFIRVVIILTGVGEKREKMRQMRQKICSRTQKKGAVHTRGLLKATLLGHKPCFPKFLPLNTTNHGRAKV